MTAVSSRTRDSFVVPRSPRCSCGCWFGVDPFCRFVAADPPAVPRGAETASVEVDGGRGVHERSGIGMPDDGSLGRRFSESTTPDAVKASVIPRRPPPVARGQALPLAQSPTDTAEAFGEEQHNKAAGTLLGVAVLS